MVEEVGAAEQNLGLTEGRIQTHVEMRLRSAGLIPRDKSTRDGYFYVNIHVVGPAYHITLKYRRRVYFSINSQSYVKVATTWSLGSTGTHGEDGGYIIQKLDGYLDKFINDYLKANQK